MTWKEANNGLTNLSIVSMFVFNNYIYASTLGEVFRSADNGISWSVANDGLPGYSASSFAAVGENLFVGTMGGGVFKSTNYGVTWVSKNDSLFLMYPNITTIVSNNTNLLVGTTSDGIFLSTNNGDSWENINSNSTERYITAIGIDEPYIYINGTDGYLWRSLLSSVTTVEQFLRSTSPYDYDIKQNYPNPFNPTTNITFSIPSDVFVSLKIFDINGREVARIVSEILHAGNYTRQWNAGKMPSGVYFYRLQAGMYTQTKQLLLLK